MFSKKLFLFVVTFLLASGAVGTARAQEVTSSVELTPTSIESPTPEISHSPVGYDLPYPGLLPDHSFYFLKTARDKIMSIMISNPVKKAEFNLLMMDKRVQASYLLVMRGKDKSMLAESTLSKGLNYFEEAIAKAGEARKEGLDIHDIAAKLALANQKHLEVIKEIQEKVGKNEGKKFEGDRLRAIDLGKRVKELRP